MTAAEVPQPGVPVEDGLHEWPVARSVPGGPAREGRPVAASYLFNLGEPVTTGDAELVTGESNRPATNFPGFSVGSNRVDRVVEETGLARRLESLIKQD